MRHPERVEDYLGHILQAIERAERYMAPLQDEEALRHDDLAQDAIVRNLEIIGEAAARVLADAPEFVAAHPQIPWRDMRGIRNKVIHEYFAVDWGVVWGTVKIDLPVLERQIEAVLAGLRHA